MARSGLKHGAKGEGRRADYLKKRISRVLKRGFLGSLTPFFLYLGARGRGGREEGREKRKGEGVRGVRARKGKREEGAGGGRGRGWSVDKNQGAER